MLYLWLINQLWGFMNKDAVITVTAYFNSATTGEPVEKTFQVTWEDVNDVAWYGGDCGDCFFDDEFEDDNERFNWRMKDIIEARLNFDDSVENDAECDEVEPDPDVVGTHTNGIYETREYKESWDYGEFTEEDFYPE